MATTGYPQQTFAHSNPTPHLGTTHQATGKSQGNVAMPKPRSVLSKSNTNHVRKKVHWASETDANEKKATSRIRSSVFKLESPIPHSSSFARAISASMNPATFSSPRSPGIGDSSSKTGHSSRSGRSIVPEANISKPMGPSKASSPKEKREGASSSRHSASSSSSTQKALRIHYGTSDQAASSKRAALRENVNIKARRSSPASANSSSKRHSKTAKQPTQINHLPIVPEAPRHQRPPPTPRPARLATPDLDDISDRAFCYCNNSFCQGSEYHLGGGNGPLLSKMEAQMKAAKEYMKDQKM